MLLELSHLGKPYFYESTAAVIDTGHPIDAPKGA